MTTPQTPIESPFGYRSSALEVVAGIDLSGRVALVTGGYSGLGTETVRALAAAVSVHQPDIIAATFIAGVSNVFAIRAKGRLHLPANIWR